MKLPLDRTLLVEELEKVIGDLKQRRSDFPNDCCTEAAIELHKRLGKRFGLCIESGLLGNEEHTWNSYHEQGQTFYVDITAGQYGLPAILILDREEAIHSHGYIPNPRQRASIFALMKRIEETEKIEAITSLSFARPF